ncbi:cytosine deaminase [Acuticoccus mangrovi]|uniref:Cytosine deaminase n=1 Tax=Acuticoccus mangrovi TaxID=2796142 RepID=A0A934IGB3_9HYPH|nr:cytosine deaminase [Acuticoccus mangrovi]MBJ3775938.1 cytosine deaminase [Acuticoccus mangrovi]
MIVANAAIPEAFQEGPGDDLALFDVSVEAGRVALVEPAAGQGGDIDARGGILVPAFVDMHTHLDKGHIWPRQANPDGTFMSALQATGEDRVAHWSAADVRARMEFGLAAAYAYGTAAIRTHIDSIPPQDDISWPVFAEVRAAWADRVTLQGVSLMNAASMAEDLGPLFDKITGFGGLVGAVLTPEADIAERIRRLLVTAEDRGLDLDFHVDETLDPSVNVLEEVARQAIAVGFSGTITCGHCCSQMARPEADAARTLDLVAEAGLAIVSLPLCNLYLQDRHAGRTPRIRGGTLVHEMAARGIRVAIASDNTRDPFYAYGDLDMVEVWREATRVLHLDHPVGLWPRAFSTTPAAIMGLAEHGRIAPGAPADLVLFSARHSTELFSRPQIDRTVIRAGAVIDASPPDYCELDALWTSPR